MCLQGIVLKKKRREAFLVSCDSSSLCLYLAAIIQSAKLALIFIALVFLPFIQRLNQCNYGYSLRWKITKYKHCVFTYTFTKKKNLKNFFFAVNIHKSTIIQKKKQLQSVLRKNIRDQKAKKGKCTYVGSAQQAMLWMEIHSMPFDVTYPAPEGLQCCLPYPLFP